MAILGKDQILNAADRVTREVDVPEWGGSVMVRSLSGEERDKYQSGLSKRLQNVKTGGFETVPELANANAKLVAMAVVDEQGERMFRDEEAPSLGQKNAAALQRIWTVAAELSGLTDDSADEAGKRLVDEPERRFAVERADAAGIPVSRWLRSHSSAEITELLALYQLRHAEQEARSQEPPSRYEPRHGTPLRG